MIHLIDGKKVAQQKQEEIKEQTARLKAEGITPGLAVVLVGEDPASQVYVRNKERACQEIGFYSKVYRLPEETSEKVLLALIDQLNHDDKFHGLLVQLPLPEHINEDHVVNAISSQKDVDGFLPENLGALMIGEKSFVPCTPKGCLELIKQLDIPITGKKAVVVGRSNIHCWQAHCYDAFTGKCHRDNLPFQNKKLKRRVTICRYRCSSGRKSTFYYRRYD